VITGIFICVFITSHMGLTGLSREGKSYWLQQLAPIDPWTTLWAKWLLAWLPFAIVGSAFVVLIGVIQRPSLGQLAQNWLLFLSTGVGVAGITAGFGAAFPRFDWQQPNRMTTARAGCLGSILYFMYSAMMLVLIGGAQIAAPRFGNWTYAAGWAVALLITALALWLPLMVGAERLRRLEL
jgi:ABC-2 type transport system permease protein